MKVMKGLLKKNQVIIYVIALMLVVAGYLNYTTNVDEKLSVQTALEMEGDDMQIADIGDATLVSSNDVTINNTEENKIEENNNSSNNTNSVETNSANTVDDNQTNANKNTEVSEKSSTENVETSSDVNSSEYFTKSKLERNTMYSQMIETYENILNSNTTLETQKQSATEEIKKINDLKNSIMICENLISTKGFTNNIIFVNGDSVSAIIGVAELKQEEVAQIQNIIARELKTEIENIHISTK